MSLTRSRVVAASASALILVAAGCGGAAEDTAEPTSGSATETTAWEPEYVDGKLQPLPDGFPDRPITIVIADEASSAEGIQANHVQQAAESLSPVPIEIEARTDFTGIPTWEAIEYMNNDPDGKEGYMMVAFAGVGSLADIVATPVEDATGLTLDDLQEVITNENTAWYVSQCKEVGWEPTMESMVQYTKDHPGEVRFMAQSGIGGSDLGFYSYMDALGAGELDIIPVGGGLEKTAAAAACEGDVTVATAETTMPHVQAGRLDVLMVSGDERFKDLPEVPTAADLGIEGGLVSSKQFVAAADAPPQHVAWLFELMSKIAEDPAYVEKREAFPGTQVFVRDPAETDQNNRDTLKVIEQVINELGLKAE